jgi:hypothetical protein
MQHSFTNNIANLLEQFYGENAKEIFEKSQLLQYLNFKTKSANSGSKSRGSFANLYAIYVLIEDYINKGYTNANNYAQYEGAEYTKLLARQRALPFGVKLQNHALNSRMKEEFKKFFPNSEFEPILRNLETNRYWVNENLLKVTIGNKEFNLSEAIIKIIDEYVTAKQDAFQRFIQMCKDLQYIDNQDNNKAEAFVLSLLATNVDARLFEIVSYAILKFYYKDQYIIWGYDIENLTKENLKLYKTGRTNANDGGIDFVMKPLGRFFQVTETLDFKKYFLDIDKIERFPITFVVKSVENTDLLKEKIRNNALKTYAVEAVVHSYMACIEELINIPVLTDYFQKIVKQGNCNAVLQEIIRQSKVEFNYDDENEW